MIELAEGMSSGDVLQWLEGGVFLSRIDGAWEPVTLTMRPEGDGTVAVAPVGRPDASLRVRYSDVRCHWPTCGAINLPDSGYALYVQRVQRRQYRRTFNHRCVNLTVPGKWSLLKSMAAADLSPPTHSPEVVRAVFDPKYPASYEEAAELLSTRPSVAVDPYITLVGYPNTAVYYRADLSARMAYGSIDFMCPDPIAKRIRKVIGGGRQ